MYMCVQASMFVHGVCLRVHTCVYLYSLFACVYLYACVCTCVCGVGVVCVHVGVCLCLGSSCVESSCGGRR